MMRQTDQDRVRAIFQEALDVPEEERASFIASACEEDVTLHMRLEKLLRAYEADEIGIQDTGDTEVIPGMGIGGHLGRFRILQKIGEGGFGEVWMAEQTEPVRRRVALKIIKPGMDSAQVVARFEAERQALAMMEHSNIARVYDGGETDDGRPYFVMELVKGLPITEYCRRKKLDLLARIELFRQVCDGVQHAHQKGVIHRDLKPTNVLVGEVDGKPVPKVIDFGIAKALERPLTDKTLFTEFRQFVGTPEYMSPEQADLSLMDVDTRSDVYALGVLLYELLAGGPPFDSRSLRLAGFDEMRRIIREDEPIAPSIKLSRSSSGGELDAPDPEQSRLGKLVRGELDWIVQRAMAKERDRRYPSASELEEDLSRYVRGEAVTAGPPRRIYRLRRFVRRNRVAVFSTVSSVAALLVIAILLAVGLIVLSSNYDELAVARKSEREANSRYQDELLAKLTSFYELKREKAKTDLAISQLEIEVGARTLAKAASLSVDHQREAFRELERVPEQYENWLARMLRASLPRSNPDKAPESVHDYGAIVKDARVLDVSSDGRHALLLRVKGSQVHVDLVRLDMGRENMLVKHLVSMEKPDNNFDIDDYAYLESAVTYLRYLKQNYVEPAGFSLDGSRVTVTPVVAAVLMAASQHFKGGFTTFLEGADLQTRIFSVESGEQIYSTSIVPDGSEETVSAIQVLEWMRSFNWASNQDGTRLAIVVEGVLEIHAVDEKRLELTSQLRMAEKKNPIMAMSPSGFHVAVACGDRNMWFRSDEDAVINLFSGEEVCQHIVAKDMFWAENTALESLGFLDEQLLALNSANELTCFDIREIDDSNFLSSRRPISIGERPTKISRQQGRLLQPTAGSTVLLMNADELTEVDVERRVVRARMDLGVANVTINTPPGGGKRGTLFAWNQSKLQSMQLGAPVAEAVQGDRGWAPSLVVEEDVFDVETGKMRATPPQQILTPDGDFVFPGGTLQSVSPDGRFLLFQVEGERAGDAMAVTQILDCQSGDRYPVEHLRAGDTADVILPIGSGASPRTHCWAQIDGMPALVTVALPARSGRFDRICTWDARDGSLVSEVPFSHQLDADLFAEMGLDLAEPAMFTHAVAVSPDGRYVALSGVVIDSTEDIITQYYTKFQRLMQGVPTKLVSSVLILERASGAVVVAHPMEATAGPLAFSADGSIVATLAAMNLVDIEVGPAQVYLLPNKAALKTANDRDPTIGAYERGAREAIGVRMIEISSAGIDQQAVLGDMVRNFRGQVLSFSPDGSLLSVALEHSIDLYDLQSTSLLMRIDWTRILQMLGRIDFGKEFQTWEGLFKQPVSPTSFDWHRQKFEGAAFSPDGNELRIDTVDVGIGMIRIFDHAPGAPGGPQRRRDR